MAVIGSGSFKRSRRTSDIVAPVRLLRPSGEESSEPGAAEKLLLASSQGDQDSFARLYDLTSARVYGLILRVVRDPSQSAEVAQETYLDAWRQSGQFNVERGSALTWLFMIAHRRAVDRVRSSEATIARDVRYAQNTIERPYDQVSEQVIASTESQRVHRALRELTDVQREAVSLAYFSGYTHAEVSELLRIPLGTAKTRIRDGLIRMRDSLGVAT